MTDLILKHDGSGRDPRPKQLEVLNWLENNWNKSRIKVFRGATGLGKSYIARALQLSFPGSIVMTSSNHLISQNLDTYPDANFVIGGKYYDCSEDYQKARQRLFRGESTFVNPISLDRFKTKNKTFQTPKVMVVDEFHLVASMLNMLVGTNLPKERYGQAPSPENDFAIKEWFQSVMENLEKLARAQPDWKKQEEYLNQLHTIEKAYTWWHKYPSQYLPENTKTGLKIAPIEIPKFIANTLFKCDHLVLMSATPSVTAIDCLTGGKDYLYKDFGGIIPTEQRKIQFSPIAEKVNRTTTPQVVAEWIKCQLLKHPGKNTIIHVPYIWQKKLAPLLPNCLTNTPKNKGTILAQFKNKGGVWLASGCSEGIDLPDNECRLNIIPMLWKPDFGSKMVQKKMSKYGTKYFNREIITVFQQQCGRSARHANDYCDIIVGDPMLPRIVNQLRNEIPEDFLSSIQWSQ